MLNANNFKKLIHWVEISWLKIFFFFLGSLIVITSAVSIRDVILKWASTTWYQDIFSIAVYIFLLSLGVALFLLPFRHLEIITRIIKIALLPAAAVFKLWYVYTFIFIPYISLAFLILIPLTVWSALKSINLVPMIYLIDDRAALYVILILASIIFTFKGKRMAELIVRWSQPKADYSKLYAALKPSLIRVYIYLLMTTAYIISNIEDFAFINLIRFSWWIIFKKVIVEVLLTYVAFDSLLIAWQDHKDIAINHEL